MSQDRTSTSRPALGRWMLVAALLVAGLVLYFVYAPTSEPPAPPTAVSR